MPTVQGTDTFEHGDFTVPGGGPYTSVSGTPAEDGTIVHSGDPASLLIESTAALEYVQHEITTSPVRPWHGFWWRMESGDEPASGIDVAQVMVASGADGRLSYSPTTDVLFHFFGGSGTASIAYALGTWVWIEQIFDVAADPASIYSRIGGVDLTPVSLAHAVTSGVGSRLGIGASANTGKMRYSRAKWGFAASVTDWLGEPASGSARGYKRLVGPQQLSTSAATLYSAPDDAYITVRHVYVNNPSGSEIEVTLSVGADAADTRLLDQHPVAAGSDFNSRRPTVHTLAPSEILQGFADAAGAVIIIDGYVMPVA